MRAHAVLGSLLAIAIGLAACGGSGAAPAATSSGAFEASDWSASALEVPLDAPVAPILLNSNLGLGTNRLSFALFDLDGATVTDLSISMRLFRLETESGTDRVQGGQLAAEIALTERALTPGFDHVHPNGEVHAHSGARSAVYTATVGFDRTGWWGAELTTRSAGGDVEQLRVRLFVFPETQEPAIGDAAPPSRQPVLDDVDRIEQIDSSLPPNPAWHELTVAEAIDRGKPTVVAFATPRFCQTRTCGPVLDEAVAPVAARFGDQISVVHIEPFDLEAVEQSGQLIPVAALVEWGLETEPWIFVLAGDGRVAAKFEGITDANELGEAVAALLEG